jgi:hypothetical protein
MVGEGTQRAAMMRESALAQGKNWRSYERNSRSTRTFTKTTRARRGVRRRRDACKWPGHTNDCSPTRRAGEGEGRENKRSDEECAVEGDRLHIEELA